jgi:hypothetical protein
MDPRTLLSLLLLACRRDGVDALRYEQRPPIATDGGASDLALADVDGDGRLDLIATAPRARAILLMRGDGQGGFAVPETVASYPDTHAIAAADLDRDGDVDLLTTRHDAHDVTVLRNDGHAAFTMASFAARTEGKAHNHGLVVADFDEDGDADVLTNDQEQHSVALLLGDGQGAFAIAPDSPWSVGADAYPPAAADIDGDGHLDVISPLVGGAAIAVLRGDGRGAFVAAKGSERLRDRPYSLAVGDVTGDGKPDVVAAHDDADVASLLAGDGAGGLAFVRELDLGGRGYDVALVDLDGDSALDLISGCYPDAIAIQRGDGRGGFTPIAGAPIRIGRGPAAVVVGDLDGDARPDLAAAAVEVAQLHVLVRR